MRKCTLKNLFAKCASLSFLLLLHFLEKSLVLFLRFYLILLVKFLHFLDILLERGQCVVHQLLLKFVVFVYYLFDFRALHKLFFVQRFWLLFDVHLFRNGNIALCLGKTIVVPVWLVTLVTAFVMLMTSFMLLMRPLLLRVLWRSFMFFFVVRYWYWWLHMI